MDVIENLSASVIVDRTRLGGNARSASATFLGFFDKSRKLMAKEIAADNSHFSLTALVLMDPVTTVCESCEGSRYSTDALSHRYKNKNIVEILNMTAEEAQTITAKYLRKTI